MEVIGTCTSQHRVRYVLLPRRTLLDGEWGHLPQQCTIQGNFLHYFGAPLLVASDAGNGKCKKKLQLIC